MTGWAETIQTITEKADFGYYCRFQASLTLFPKLNDQFPPREKLFKLERCWFLRQSAKTMSTPACDLRRRRVTFICPETGVQLMCHIFMNDLLTE